MRYSVKYSKPAQKDIQKFSPQIRKRIGVKLRFYYSQPNPLKFAERLSKKADAQYRFRVGNFRILFDIDGSALKVLRVQHRKDVYRK